MCKRRKRKSLYNYVKLYQNGFITEEQINQVLYSYAVDVTTEKLQKQINVPEETNQQTQGADAEIDGIMNSIPEEVPQKVKEDIKQKLTFSFAAMGAMRQPSPIEKIMQPNHITAIIENTDKDSQREFEERKINKIYLFGVFIVSLLFIIVLLY